MNKTTFSALAVAAILLSGAHAALADTATTAGSASADATESAPQTEGEIRKVDAATGKLTIRHGPIANLDMGAMTMVFRVQDPAMLGQVKEGDRVRFTAERVSGALTVTRIEVQP